MDAALEKQSKASNTDHDGSKQKSGMKAAETQKFDKWVDSPKSQDG